jgi:hypothetical protein
MQVGEFEDPKQAHLPANYLYWLFLAVTWLYLEWTTIQNWKATCNPDLEAGRHKFLTWILAWRSWGLVAMKNLGPGKIVQTFNPRRPKQGDLWVQGKVSLEQYKSQIQLWWHKPLIWATPSTGDLPKDIGRRKTLKTPLLLALWGWATARSLDFQSELLLTIVGKLNYRL